MTFSSVFRVQRSIRLLSTANRSPLRLGVSKPQFRVDGFTLVEVLIGILILSVVSIGSVVAINVSTRNLTRSSEINELNALIEADLAAVREANDRFVCNNGTCSISNADLTRDQYFPAIADSTSLTNTELENVRFFKRRCGSLSDAGTFDATESLGVAIVAALNDAAQLPAPDPRIQREIATVGNSHRFRVSYISSEDDATILRQVTLLPSTVAWCPCVPSEDGVLSCTLIEDDGQP